MKDDSVNSDDTTSEAESRDESQAELRKNPHNSMTLQEPIKETIIRDMRIIYAKLMLFVLKPEKVKESREMIANWDLWGPFLIYLLFAMLVNQSNHNIFKELG